jgi:ubiquinone/menaquinone biosynthesis C-methylase UbiE
MERNGYARSVDRHQLEAIQAIVADVSPSRVLEIGCATGRLLRHFRAMDCEAVGLEMSLSALEKADGLSPLVQADGTALPFADESFDLVVANHVIEHVPDVDSFMSEVTRVTKTGGRVFLSYPQEPVRGLFASVASLRMFHHPFGGRRIHLRKIDPLWDLGFLTIGYSDKPLSLVYGGYALWPLPQRLVTLEKTESPAVGQDS